MATLVIRWRLDGSLRNRGNFVGFEFGSEEERQDGEAQDAIEVARAVNASTLAVVGVREYNGRRSIVGTVLSMETGKPLRSAAISVEPVQPSAEKIRALGRFLGGDKEAAKLFPNASIGEVTLAPSRQEYPPWHADKLGWAVTSTGLVAVAVGSGFLVSASSLESQAERESDHIERGRLEEKASSRHKTGIVFAVTGGVVLAAGIVRLAIYPKKKRTAKPLVEVGFGLNSIAVRGRF